MPPIAEFGEQSERSSVRRCESGKSFLENCLRVRACVVIECSVKNDAFLLSRIVLVTIYGMIGYLQSETRVEQILISED